MRGFESQRRASDVWSAKNLGVHRRRPPPNFSFARKPGAIPLYFIAAITNVDERLLTVADFGRSTAMPNSDRRERSLVPPLDIIEEAGHTPLCNPKEGE